MKVDFCCQVSQCMILYPCMYIYTDNEYDGIGGVSMVSIMSAAHYLVHLSYGEKRRSLTSLKLQKLLYLAQGWSYVWDNRPLFQAEFEAWQYGPVNAEVYNYFKKYGRDEIPEREGFEEYLDKDSRETLEAVWDKYCSYSAFELVELTHRQEPWKNAYRRRGTIKNSDIKLYFQSTY